MDAKPLRRREYYPDLSDIVRPGERMIAVHVANGRCLDAYAAWRYVWNQIREHHFTPQKPPLVTDPVEWYFGESISAALNAMSISCIEDFDGWTAKEMIEKNVQLNLKSIEEIRKVLGVFDMTLD